MFVLVAPLLFIGFFSPANSETVDSESQTPNEHLISLRDYDFVGEDQRLSALLAERMAVLQAPLNLSDLDAEPWPLDPGPFQPKPPQQVNVSMDYAEYFNASDWLLKVNASLPDPAPGPGGLPAPGPGGPPAPGPGGPPAPGPGGPPAPGYVRASGTGWAPGPGPNRDFRRKNYRDQSERNHSHKLMELMKQCIYNAQHKILELTPLVTKYESDPRFRIAFIFNRLDEWLHDLRTVTRKMRKWRYWPWRVKWHITYYEHALALNIDITYTVEALVHLHNSYMTNVANIMPIGEQFQINKLRHEQRKMKKMKALGLTTQASGFQRLSTTRVRHKIDEYY